MLKLLLFLFPLSSYAISLQSIITSYDVVEQVPKLENSVSYIENVAIRGGQTQDQSSGDIDNEIEVRFSLNGLKEQDQLERLYKNQQNRLEADRLESLNKELGLVYRLYLKLYFGKSELVNLKKLKTIFQDEVKVLKVYIKKDKTYISDLINSEKNLHEVEKLLIIKEKELNRELALLNGLIKKKITKRDIPKKERLMSSKRVLSFVEKSKSLPVQVDLDLEKAKLEYDLEVGENNKLFDFVQFDVDRNNVISQNNDLETRVGFTLAINLPFLRDKSKVNEKFISKLKAEYAAKYEQKATVAVLDQIKTSVVSYGKSLEQLLNSSYLTTARKYLKIYNRSKGVDPLKLLTLNHTIVQGEVEEAKLSTELYINYVSYLEETGALAKFPKINVLDRNFKGKIL